ESAPGEAAPVKSQLVRKGGSLASLVPRSCPPSRPPHRNPSPAEFVYKTSFRNMASSFEVLKYIPLLKMPISEDGLRSASFLKFRVSAALQSILAILAADIV